MPGRVAGLSRAMRCAILLRDTRAAGRLVKVVPRCVYCDRGVIARAQVGESRYALAAATMDHVDPGAGTHPGNLVTACWSCNCSKRDRTACQWGRDTLAVHHWSRYADRAAAAVALRLDLAAGRLWARDLYPRPCYSLSKSVDSQSFTVYAEQGSARVPSAGRMRRGPGRRHGGAEPPECDPA